MKSSKLFLATTTTLLIAAAAQAASVNMDDPRRALGREDDVRVDAQIFQETVSSGSPIAVTYQIQNLTASTVAIAAKTASATYDPETQTITVSIGSEVPDSGHMPQLVTIAPGEKKTLQVAATPQFVLPRVQSPYVSAPRYVQVKVNILRHLEPFVPLIERQGKSPNQRIALSDELFDRWLESNDAIFLNAIPVRWQARDKSAMPDAERRSRGSF
ncbi:MAG TPA: hypothetical protein VGF69_02970 [Thermoanaerobaculia bacterium]|jgi:hypothetical protein